MCLYVLFTICYVTICRGGRARGSRSESSSESSYNNCDIDSTLRDEGIEVLSKIDDGYDEAKEQFASTLIDFADSINPTYIAYAASSSDIQKIVSFVNNCDEIESITIRSGGHQWSGTSSCDDKNGGCLQLDVSLIDDLEILDPDYIDDDNDDEDLESALVRIGTGLSFEDFYAYGAQYGLVFLGGNCQEVHVGGNYQSSGHNAFNHALGSAMDYIKGFEIVLADGSIVYVNKDNNYGDLFWALRGGSPGAFGVVVSYDVKVYYASNFPHSALSYTIYKYGNNNENDKEIGQTIGELYNQASGHPAFVDSLDIGSVYSTIKPIYDASTDLQALLNLYGANHYIAVLVVYLGLC